ncbi:hypothetical protein [uncultured Brevibacillus sp.]|uniref:hypothetical protein n=1 Tax=uncultured Brevibacillus sp. TaxID=169970 RepID=UPI002594FE75|nr:hypothetical protein [uncultured Brevibacillus sp.]
MERNENFTDFFVLTAKDFLAEKAFPGLLCAYAGGSVGRGEADAYSDLDLNIIVEGISDHTSENCRFRGQIIQLHIHPVPTNEAVYENPWSWRYIKEARLIHDPDGRYLAWLHAMCDYLDSEDGKSKMLAQGKRIIEEYRAGAKQALSLGRGYSAFLAAWASWIGAVQLFAYFYRGTVADRGLYQMMKELGLTDEVERLIKESADGKQDLQERLKLIAAYRNYLRSQKDEGMFALDPLNDELLYKKVERMQRKEEEARFLLFSEAIWLYLCGDADRWLEEHWESLPTELSLPLKRLGFFEADERLIQRIHTISNEIIAKIG